MAKLNPRQEAFAQLLAAGKTQAEAYELAGFKRHDSNASSLARSPAVAQRVAELQAEQVEVARKATELAAERLSVDREWVMARLVENVNRAMQAQAVTDREGEPTGEFRYDGNVANRALELLGKEIGMFIDRSKVDMNANVSLENYLDALPGN